MRSSPPPSKTNTTSSRTRPDWSIPTTSHRLGSSSSSRGREFSACSYAYNCLVRETITPKLLTRTGVNLRRHESTRAPPRQTRQNGSRSPRGQRVQRASLRVYSSRRTATAAAGPSPTGGRPGRGEGKSARSYPRSASSAHAWICSSLTGTPRRRRSLIQIG